MHLLDEIVSFFDKDRTIGDGYRTGLSSKLVKNMVLSLLASEEGKTRDEIIKDISVSQKYNEAGLIHRAFGFDYALLICASDKDMDEKKIESLWEEKVRKLGCKFIEKASDIVEGYWHVRHPFRDDVDLVVPQDLALKVLAFNYIPRF